jgi:hypothetical protein
MGILAVSFEDHGLEIIRIFSEVMPKAGQIGPIAGAEFFAELPREPGYRQQVILKPLPGLWRPVRQAVGVKRPLFAHIFTRH